MQRDPRRLAAGLEQLGYAAWARYVLGFTAPMAPHHEQFWQHVWSIEAGARPRPITAWWARGAGKSANTEGAVVALAARQRRRYCWYISGNQDLADNHVAGIAGILESPMLAQLYPDLAQRAVTKFGAVKGWRRNRLWTRSGFVVDAAGLETGLRGARVEDQRPDLIIFDDVDHRHDSPAAVAKKIEVITQSILPAGSTDVAVIFVQNLIHPDSIASQLADGRADFLLDRITIGPVPAIRDLEVERVTGDDGVPAWKIVHGTPTWVGQSIEVCEGFIANQGLTAFMREAQHEVEPAAGGIFDHLEFDRCDPDEVPDLVDVVVAVDPAVSNTDASDAHGIQVDGLGGDGRLYRLHSWEERTSPQDAVRRALKLAVEYGASTVQIETDTGGDAWLSVFREQWTALQADEVEWAETTGRRAARRTASGPVRKPKYRTIKAGSIGSKVERASKMVVGYETGKIVHVRGTHLVLERALRRFPAVKPFDLVDASVYGYLHFLGRPQRQGRAAASAAGRSVDL